MVRRRTRRMDSFQPNADSVLHRVVDWSCQKNARAAMKSFVIFMVFNYFIQGILTLSSADFGVDFSKNAGSCTGLTMRNFSRILSFFSAGNFFLASHTGKFGRLRRVALHIPRKIFTPDRFTSFYNLPFLFGSAILPAQTHYGVCTIDKTAY